MLETLRGGNAWIDVVTKNSQKDIFGVGSRYLPSEHTNKIFFKDGHHILGAQRQPVFFKMFQSISKTERCPAFQHFASRYYFGEAYPQKWKDSSKPKFLQIYPGIPWVWRYSDPMALAQEVSKGIHSHRSAQDMTGRLGREIEPDMLTCWLTMVDGLVSLGGGLAYRDEHSHFAWS